MIASIILPFLIVLLCAFVICTTTDDDKPYVQTPLGKIHGHVKTSHRGRKIAAFEGIPFAKPPINSRRFEEPEPVEPWNDTIQATSPTLCAQTQMTDQKIIKGAEDCLHLNVYVPRELPNSEQKLDVIVHIHGGAFMYGGGHVYAHPQYILDKDIIFVTFNYRLGILGFLSTEDDVVPGNNGLKDQVAALKWVQENIASFGGNPGSITLHGLSAGGASVHLHYLSNMSKGLFHRGFSQSGTAINQWTLQKRPAIKSKMLAEAVECPTNTSLLLVECIKQKPFNELLAKTPIFFDYLFIPLAPFAPVIEKGTKPFLSEDPYELLKRGQVEDLPWISSNTADEGLLPTAYLINNLEEVNDNWEDLAPILLDYQYTLPKSQWKEAAQRIKEFYLGNNQDINLKTFPQFVKMASDRHFLIEAEDAVKMQASVTQSPVYYYYFGYPGDNNIYQTVAHGEDRKYFFGNRQPNATELSHNELEMLRVMTDMLVNFAKAGKPTIDGVTWESIVDDKLKYLNITGFELKNIKLETIDQLTPKKFWRSLEFRENININLTQNEL